jgi:hypothetical protein
VVELLELHGTQIAILGLHHDEHGTVLHMLASDVTLEGDWKYARGVRPPAGAVDVRQQRPLTRHTHQRRESNVGTLCRSNNRLSG